ncbi:sugar ABC transporter permease [uncultured Gemmiger sp.]|uniref:carbohydrate ABC transporter permease n=1 Tax=uncultured Gemmiger sp. TaxID=1623490 RepID=UPI0025CDA301|nr:sugar ABC transporter permease [uncultured Gemmiger sp.]
MKRTKKKRSSGLGRAQVRLAMVFIAPWVIGFVAFSLYPIVTTLYYSFTEYNLFSPPKWVGLQNYVDMFGDENFRHALYNSLWFVVIGVPLQLALAIFTAVLLNMDVRGRAFFRTIYYLPALVPPVAGALI